MSHESQNEKKETAQHMNNVAALTATCPDFVPPYLLNHDAAIAERR
jgi:hypothetical protein